MSNAGAIVAAVRLRKEREIVAFLKQHGAVSATTAVQIEPQNLVSKAALRSLVRHRAVIGVANGAYFLESDAYETLRSRRRMRIAIVIVVALGVAIAVFLANGATP